jgi:GNAT superfamily N-acetyltransferase
MPLTQTLEALQAEFQTQLILKVVEAGRIVGSLRAFEKNGTVYIGRVIVHPEFQNRGLGKKLMLDIETRFPNAQRFELFTGYKDEKNLYFYFSLGYTIFKDEAHGEMKFVFFEKVAPGY